MIRPIVKAGLIGSLGVGSLGVALNGGIDLDSFTIVRVARVAYAAIGIGYAYKTLLYSKDYDKTSQEYKDLKHKAHQIGADKLLALCRSNKGVYVKVGQHVGALDYLLPSEYVKTMRILHKDAPSNNMIELQKVIEKDLKKKMSELFVEFDPVPLGTASLAQVHRAKLHDGTVVAVKVQHHFVRKNIDLDLRTMEVFIGIMSKLFPDFRLQWLVDITKKNILKELDFLNEGRNAERVAEMFKHVKWLKVPKIYWNISTDRVLVMEYVEGGLVNDINYVKENKIDPFDLSKKLGDLYSHMIFVKGFVHSDPHPGNILIKKKRGDKDTTVYLLDHGLYTELDDRFRYHYSKLWLSIIDRNKDGMKFHANELGIKGNLYILFACMVTGRPWDTIMKGIDRTKPSKQEKATFQDELPNFMNQITDCLEHVDRQALLVLKTNDLIRSIEYALRTHEGMCGFLVMAQCCVKSVYYNERSHTEKYIRKFVIRLSYMWSMLRLYLLVAYLGMRTLVMAER